jgi:hypothetical protein
MIWSLSTIAQIQVAIQCTYRPHAYELDAYIAINRSKGTWPLCACVTHGNIDICCDGRGFLIWKQNVSDHWSIIGHLPHASSPFSVNFHSKSSQSETAAKWHEEYLGQHRNWMVQSLPLAQPFKVRSFPSSLTAKLRERRNMLGH